MNQLFNMIDLSIIIVSYNTKEFLRDCINSLLNSVSEKISYEIVVVDNFSSDGSAEMVKKEFSEVIFPLNNSKKPLASEFNDNALSA